MSLPTIVKKVMGYCCYFLALVVIWSQSAVVTEIQEDCLFNSNVKKKEIALFNYVQCLYDQ